MPADHRRDASPGAWIGTLAIVAFSVWLRMPGFTEGGFASHDVGGILYNAMLLHDGALPYVDSVELKAPGSFWLAKWLAGPEGRDIARFQIWANLWGVLALVAVASIAARCFGARAAVVAAGLYALHDAHLDSMDANYVTWSQLPSILAVGWALAAMRCKAPIAAAVGWSGAGLLAGLATLIKHPAGATVIVVLVLALIGDRDRAGTRKLAVLAVLAGVIASHLPIVIRYAIAGELGALVDGYVWPSWAVRYVAAGGRRDATPPIIDGAWASAFFIALPLALALAAIRPPHDASQRRTAFALSIWAAAALASACIGMRFYKGYFLCVLPPLCILAAAPWGLVGTHSRVRGVARIVALAPALLLVVRQALVLEQHRIDRARPHDEGGRVIAKHVSEHSAPGDRIWVWGWHLWDVYAFTGLRSGSRIYKSLGLLTPPNDDTWRLPASPLTFVDGPAAKMVIDDLRASRPAWIVLGSTVPRGQFTALRELLHEAYVLDHRVTLGRVQFWQRRDRARGS